MSRVPGMRRALQPGRGLSRGFCIASVVADDFPQLVKMREIASHGARRPRSAGSGKAFDDAVGADRRLPLALTVGPGHRAEAVTT